MSEYSKNQKVWVKENSAQSGMKVKVIRKLKREHEGAYPLFWSKLQDNIIGKSVKIADILSDCITVAYKGDEWAVPYFVLEIKGA